MQIIQRTLALFSQSGELATGRGRVSGVIALSLALLCLLGVVAFHLPEYLTTPELREKYSVDSLRLLMLGGLLLSGGLALANIILNRARWLSASALLIVIGATALGGERVPVGEVPAGTPYIGLDWFILDLLGSTLVFVLIEKLFPLYRGQPVFRTEWQTDFVHFGVNHFLVGLTLLIVNYLIHRVFGWASWPELQAWVQALPFLVELFACLLVADLVQYWTHRAYHEVPLLWRFHAVHHSTKVMDWMAGSRLHLLEVVTTRVSILGVLFVCGFEKSVMDAYIVIVGFQAVFNHANVSLPWGPLQYVLVTPDFHHWHHSSDRVALDRNYAAHFSFLDYLFGTAVKGQSRRFPEQYGVLGDYMPEGFVKQQLFPFTHREK
ncbi:MAG TPA: sterol desaturase family protein [Verrucomicrobiae bacterium]|nr:sterol desaturase family protein [Verrucomicrobiae bacterium]